MGRPVDDRGPGTYMRFAVRRSEIHGMGLFAICRIPPRRKLGELTGEIVTWREGRRRTKGKRKLALVELEDGTSIDASQGGNEFRYVNHACSPNAYIRICYGRVEFYSLRLIARGEEITCDYGDTHHNGKLECSCGYPNCRGHL